MAFPLAALLSFGEKVIDKVIPDPQTKAQALLELKKLEKDGQVSKDELTRGEKELEKVTSDHVNKIDEILKHKESELLEV